MPLCVSSCSCETHVAPMWDPFWGSHGQIPKLCAAEGGLWGFPLQINFKYIFKPMEFRLGAPVNARKIGLNIINSKLGLKTINSKLGCHSNEPWQCHGSYTCTIELQGMQTHGTVLSIPKALVKFLWVVPTHRKSFTATWGPWLRSRVQGGRPKMIQTKQFLIRKVNSNSAKLHVQVTIKYAKVRDHRVLV